LRFCYHCVGTLQVGLSPLAKLLAADFTRWGGAESSVTPSGSLVGAGISNVGWSVLFGIDLGRLVFTFRWHCRAAVAVWAYVASTFRLYLSQ